MGILDDAIRQHLELKRQHGADSDDVERLEKEAFGPPTRPGDPEFDTSESQAAAGATATEAAEGDVAAPPEAADAPAADSSDPAPSTDERIAAGIFDSEADSGDEDWLATLEDVVEQPALGTPGEQRPVEPTPESAEQALPPLPEPGAAEEDLTEAERARLEHPNLGDTVAHPVIPEPGADEQTGEQEASEPTTDPGAIEPPEPPESAIFDHGEDEAEDEDESDELGDLDLELDIEEAEEEIEAATGSSPVAEPTTDPGLAPATDEEPLADEDFEDDDEEEDDLEDEDEDLLDKTPDFLQDTPEGDRLWFEQSGPKDFDFEDDDDKD